MEQKDFHIHFYQQKNSRNESSTKKNPSKDILKLCPGVFSVKLDYFIC